MAGVALPWIREANAIIMSGGRGEFDWLCVATPANKSSQIYLENALKVESSTRRVRESEHLTVGQARLLLLLAAHGPCKTATDVARLVDRTLPTTLVAVGKLYGLGLIDQKTEAGSRGRRICLSEEGLAVADRLKKWALEPDLRR